MNEAEGAEELQNRSSGREQPEAAPPLVACVPNFAEARDGAVVTRLLAAMRLPGVRLLHLDQDAAANRTIVTIAGPPPAVSEAAIRACGAAVDAIDLTRRGSSAATHPRIGGVDVLPFVPLAGCSLGSAALLAREAAAALWSRYHLPSYLYAAAASRPDRVELVQVRAGQFEGLREAVLRDAGRRPDVGGPGLHPTAGACAVGARPVLVEYRVLLGDANLRVARGIARALRNGLAAAGGLQVLPLFSEGTGQLAITLTRWRDLGPDQVHRQTTQAARELGTSVLGNRLVGLLPEAASQANPEWTAALLDFHPASSVLEQRLAHPLAWP